MKSSIPIESLPSIKRFSGLAEAVKLRKLVIFTGAGISRLDGCHSWRNLCESLISNAQSLDLINEIEKQFLTEITDNKKLITILKEIYCEESKLDSFIDSLEKSLLVGGESSINDSIYNYIYQLGSFFVSTNADNLFDLRFNQDRIISIFSENVDPIAEELKLYKIHGSINDFDSMVFTVSKYLERYRNPNFINFLTDIFENHTVLFLGYGLAEFELLDFTLSKLSIGAEPKHFVLEGYFSNEQSRYKFDQYYFKSLSVTIIPYLKDKNGHRQQKEVLKHWFKECKYELGDGLTDQLQVDDLLKNFTEYNASTLSQFVFNNKVIEEYFWNRISEEDFSLEWAYFLKKHKKLDIPIKVDIKRIESPDGSFFQKSPWPQFAYLRQLSNRNAPSKSLLNRTISEIINDYIKKLNANPDSTLLDSGLFRANFCEYICALDFKTISSIHLQFIESCFHNPASKSYMDYILAHSFLDKALKYPTAKFLNWALDCIFKIIPTENDYENTMTYGYSSDEVIRKNKTQIISKLGTSAQNLLIEYWKERSSRLSYEKLLSSRSFLNEAKHNRNISIYGLIVLFKELHRNTPIIKWRKDLKKILNYENLLFDRLLLILLNERKDNHILNSIFQDKKHENRIMTCPDMPEFIQFNWGSFETKIRKKIIRWVLALPSHQCKEWMKLIIDSSSDNDDKDLLKIKKTFSDFLETNSYRKSHLVHDITFSSGHTLPHKSLTHSITSIEEAISLFNSDWNSLHDRFPPYDDDDKRFFLSKYFLENSTEIISKINEIKNQGTAVISCLFDILNTDGKRDCDLDNYILEIFSEISESWNNSLNLNLDEKIILRNFIEFITNDARKREDQSAYFICDNAFKMIISLTNKLSTKPEINDENLIGSILSSQKGTLSISIFEIALQKSHIKNPKKGSLDPLVEEFLLHQIETEQDDAIGIIAVYLPQLTFMNKNFVFKKLLPSIMSKNKSEFFFRAFIHSNSTVYLDLCQKFKVNFIKTIQTKKSKDLDTKRVIEYAAILWSANLALGKQLVLVLLKTKSINKIHLLTQKLSQLNEIEDSQRIEMVKMIRQLVDGLTTDATIFAIYQDLISLLLYSFNYSKESTDLIIQVMERISSFNNAIPELLASKVEHYPDHVLRILSQWAKSHDHLPMNGSSLSELASQLIAKGYETDIIRIHSILLQKGSPILSKFFRDQTPPNSRNQNQTSI